MTGYQILKPDIHHHYLKTKDREKVTYLKIPSGITKEKLNQDLKKGAVYLKEIRKLLEKKNLSRYIVLHTDNKERGLMSVMYLAACLAHKGSLAEEEEDQQFMDEPEQPLTQEELFKEDDKEDMSFLKHGWKESWTRLPLINDKEIEEHMFKGNDDYIFRNMSMQRDMGMWDKRPYWIDCTTEAVCILFENGWYEMRADQYLEALTHFQDNRRVFLLFCNTGPWSSEMYTDDDMGFDGDSGSVFRFSDQLILEFSADEAAVFMDEAQRKRFYKGVLQGFFERYQLQTAKGFSYVKLVNVFASLRDRNVCSAIEKVVRYALKDKEPGEPLTNEDFSFMKRFFGKKAADSSDTRKKHGSAMERMMTQLTGMTAVKEQVRDVIQVMKYNTIRKKMGIEGGQYHNVHVMMGAPGTAKTTVANFMGKIMEEEKLLPDCRSVCINGAELKGKYVGHTAPKVHSLFENYDVIVIDEAYSLVDDRGETDSFSKEAIAQLIIELEEHSMDKLGVFAGYGGKKVTERNNKMKDFINSNPGIRSRINSTFYFDSYTPEEMVAIVHRMAELANYRMDPKVDPEILAYFAERMLDPNFGNGREARNLLEGSVVCAARRVLSSDKKLTANVMKELTKEDVRGALQKCREDQKLLNLTNHRKIGFGCPA